MKCSAAPGAAPLTIACVLALACEPERPPAPTDAAPQEASETQVSTASWSPVSTPAVLTYAGDRGTFADAKAPDTIPEAARGLVRVKLLAADAPSPPAGQVWVANLRTPEPDGSYALKTVPREMFEELALGEGLSSQVSLPEGLEPPQNVAAAEGIVVYKTAWCGVCKKLEAYLDRKGVKYVAKDIEQDPQAAAELQAKAKAKGVGSSSVPVIDVGGELIVGFDRARLEKLL